MSLANEFMPINLDAYATFDEAYPLITYGQADERCNNNRDCLPGLMCMNDVISGAKVCGAPQTSNVCYRSANDQRCHTVTENGYTVICPDSEGPPIPVAPPQRTESHKCNTAERYKDISTGVGLCLHVDNHTGVPELVPERCCNKVMVADYDLEEEYVKYAVSPQYYGLFR